MAVYGVQCNWPLVFIDQTTERKAGIIRSVRGCISAQIQPNATEMIGRLITVQMDNDPK